MAHDDQLLLLHKHSRREFRTRMNSGELKACIIPVAAIEQHLEHLAMEHDWRSANHIAIEVARTLSPSVLVAQGVMAGISEHHMKHPGTLTLSPATFLAVLGDLIDSVVRAGIHKRAGAERSRRKYRALQWSLGSDAATISGQPALSPVLGCAHVRGRRTAGNEKNSRPRTGIRNCICAGCISGKRSFGRRVGSAGSRTGNGDSRIRCGVDRSHGRTGRTVCRGNDRGDGNG